MRKTVWIGLLAGGVLLAGIAWAGIEWFQQSRTEVEVVLKVGQDSVGTDTLGVWCKTRGAKGGFRPGKIWRFNGIEGVMWRWDWGSSTTQDAACTLFVWHGEKAGRVDSSKIYSCSDTIPLPKYGAIAHNAATPIIQGAWEETSLDSALVVPVGTDSTNYVAIHVVGNGQ